MLPVVASFVSLLAVQEPAPAPVADPAPAPVIDPLPVPVVESAPVVAPAATEAIDPATEPVAASTTATAATTPTAPPTAPFDTTWMNGQSRQKTFPLGTIGGVVTPSLYLDVGYAFSANQPIDHTLTGTGSIGRHNELGVNLASVGLDWNVANVIGRVSVQFGSQLAMVQEGDASASRGFNLSADALKHLREAAIGYHFDVLAGVNVEAGLLSSFVGVDSYLLGENWAYNRALVSEFTPFYFTGIRAQFFLHETFKIEPWLINGYQTYGRFNEAPAVAVATRWVPAEWFALTANLYVGSETRGDPERVRLHHDHSINVRFLNAPESFVLSKLALSLNNHLGTEVGGDAPDVGVHHFIGTSAVLRAWTLQDRVAVTGRFEWVRQPGGYSLQLPPPGFVADDAFTILGVTAGLDFMPTDFISIRPELVYRTASSPFFAGPGGVTSSDGWRDTADADFVADVVNDQLLFTVGATFRL